MESTLVSLGIILFNLILFFSAKKIFGLFTKKEQKLKIFFFRLVNISYAILQTLHIFISMGEQETEIFKVISSTIVIIYVMILLFELSAYMILKRFSDKRVSENSTTYHETHQSRLMTLVTGFVFLIGSIVILINYWGFNSLLEAGGILGIFFGFLAITASIWFPDIWDGLVLLNDSLVNDGDIIEIEENKYLVMKFGVMETILSNIENNHKSVIKNSSLRDNIIDNLNKHASTYGIRESVLYKVGYADEQDYELFFNKVEKIKDKIEKYLFEHYPEVNQSQGVEWFVEDPSDYAIVLKFAYYLTDLKDIRTTNKARKIFSIKKEFHKRMLIETQKEGLGSLSTPVLYQNVTSNKEIERIIEDNNKN